MSDFNPILGDEDEDGAGVIFQDFWSLLAMVFLFLVPILILLLNPPKQEESEGIKAPGSVIVELSWPNDRNVDLDLWVQAPNEKPVGYSNRAGMVFNLLRDDRGDTNDLAKVNLENAYSRGTPAGEYCVNVHYFSSADGGSPTECVVTVAVKATAEGPAERLVTTTLTLTVGQEDTAFRFRLNQDGTLVPGSISHLYKPLRLQRD
ncbi:MAG: hypothetical protein KDD64_04920 [Bdellovibrionales bacterium]|nr:hypothetical protein [Bdellovibrionales bacterium]